MLVSKIGVQYTNLQTKKTNASILQSKVNNTSFNKNNDKLSFKGFREWWEETKAYWNSSSANGLDNPLEGGSLSFEHNDGPIKWLYERWYEEYKELKALNAKSSLSGEAARRFGALAAKLAKKGGYKL